MKFIATALVVFLSLATASCASHMPYQQYASPQQMYDSDAAKISQRYKDGQITHLQSVQQMLFISKTYFPNDQLLHSSWERIVGLAGEYERKEIDKDQFNSMVNQTWETFDAANRARQSAFAQQQQAAQDQQRAAAVGGFLQQMSNSLNRTYRPAVQCNTWGTNTVCQ